MRIEHFHRIEGRINRSVSSGINGMFNAFDGQCQLRFLRSIGAADNAQAFDL